MVWLGPPKEIAAYVKTMCKSEVQVFNPEEIVLHFDPQEEHYWFKPNEYLCYKKIRVIRNAWMHERLSMENATFTIIDSIYMVHI